MELEIVGAGINRLDVLEKVAGAAKYGCDLKFAGMLYGKTLRSKIVHGDIISINTEKAKKLSGVRAVVTGKDFFATYGPQIKDQPFLAYPRVRYMAEPIAAVAAIDPDIAEEAISLIEVEYKELPVILDPAEAMKPDAFLIHELLHEYKTAVRPLKGTNVCTHSKLRKGDVERGFEESYYISEDTFINQMVNHCPMETHSAIAQFDVHGGLTIWAASQAPFGIRAVLAQALDMPESKVRIIVPYLGGGFGSRAYTTVETIAIALAKFTNNRPVKVVFDREENFTASVVKHPCIVKIKTGVSKDGSLVARKVEAIYDTGAYADCGPNVCRNGTYAATGPYKIPNAWVDGYCVYTNKISGGAFRGYGIPQVTWAYESQLDMIADKLGIDPLEIRLKNAVEERDESATGEILHSVGLKEALKDAARELGWNSKKKGNNRGFGIACMYKATSSPTTSSSMVRVDDDGTVNIFSGSVEMGQGSNTILTQIVAEELGIKPDKIFIVQPDTDITPFDQKTTGSRSTYHMGNAVKEAAHDARQKILRIASDILEASQDDLIIKDGKIFVKGSPEKSITIGEAIKKHTGGKGGIIVGESTFFAKGIIPLDRETGQSPRPTAFWMYGAQAAEVEVDTETGMVNVVKLTGAHDVGKAINPVNCQQQIEGGMIMGLGMALYEEVKYLNGKILNANLLDYKVSTSADIPDMESVIVEAPHNEGPFGAKGLGEPVLAPTPAAIANAVYNAIGVRIKDLPITAEKILQALKNKK